jgi:hypothetical protein
VSKRQHLPAVGKHAVDGEIKTFVPAFHLRPVERAAATLKADPATGRTDASRVLDAFLEEQAVDTRVGSRLQGLLPA